MPVFLGGAGSDDDAGGGRRAEPLPTMIPKKSPPENSLRGKSQQSLRAWMVTHNFFDDLTGFAWHRGQRWRPIIGL